MVPGDRKCCLTSSGLAGVPYVNCFSYKALPQKPTPALVYHENHSKIYCTNIGENKSKPFVRSKKLYKE